MSFSHCFILVYCHSDTPSSLLTGMASICLHWCLYPSIWAIIKHLGPEPQIKALNIFRLCASWYLSLHKQLNCQSMQCSCNMYKRHHKDKRPQFLYYPSHNCLLLMEKLNPQLRKKIYFCCDILDFIALEKLAAFHINLEVTWRYDTIDCSKKWDDIKDIRLCTPWYLSLHKQLNCQSMQCSCNMYKRHHKDKRPQYLYFPSHNCLFLMETLNPQLRKKIYFCCDILYFIASEKLAAFHINLEVTWRYDTIDCSKYGMILKTYYHKSLFWIALPKEKNLCVISKVWSKDMSSNSWGPFN